MSIEESAEFRRNPHHESAVSLRRWDDAAKDPEMVTPPLAHFAAYVRQSALAKSSS